MSFTDWNQLPEGAIGTSHGKMRIFQNEGYESENQWGEVKGSEVNGSEL